MSPRPKASYSDAIRRPFSVCGRALAMRDPIRAGTFWLGIAGALRLPLRTNSGSATGFAGERSSGWLVLLGESGGFEGGRFVREEVPSDNPPTPEGPDLRAAPFD